jgi:hypothetical protein
MPKFILAASLYLAALFIGLHLFPDDQAQLLQELALDQAEFTQSLPELDALKILDPTLKTKTGTRPQPHPGPR